jgi:hypothetical protein
MVMTHPGLSDWGIISVLEISILSIIWWLWQPIAIKKLSNNSKSIGSFRQYPWLLFIVKLVVVVLFVIIIVSGLFGTPLAERNVATVLTWNWWWAGLIFSIFFLGSAWCAVCPWDSISHWLVRRTLWKRAKISNSLDLQVPKWLRNVWPALFMFIGLTWLELGLGITIDPYATAIVSLLMVLMATVSLSIFKRKAFCQYFCPVGRTIGFYSQLSILSIRAVDTDKCAQCKSLACYHGTKEVEPCPTNLVMGTLTQNTYCTSCGNCSQSCPDNNVTWALRSPSIEAISNARPHWDEAWFMLVLLALTAFHGISMMPFWEALVNNIAGYINDSGQLLITFTIILTVVLLGFSLLYSATGLLINKVSATSFKKVFTTFAFVNLPLAFAYHMAHNLNHLIREPINVASLITNPMGVDALPLSMMEKHTRHFDMWFSQDNLELMQVFLMIFGLWVAIQVVRHRSASINVTKRLQQLPMVVYLLVVTYFHLWMLSQPMIMRM